MHVVALTQDKSSTDLTSKELDRVVAAFRLLADPDDFDAMMIWLHPENGVRDRQIWFIENRVVESYARKVCQSKFGTGDWHSLTNESVRDLVMTLKNRPSALKPSHTAKPAPVPRDDRPPHPINLAKERELRKEREAAEFAEAQPF